MPRNIQSKIKSTSSHRRSLFRNRISGQYFNFNSIAILFCSAYVIYGPSRIQTKKTYVTVCCSTLWFQNSPNGISTTTGNINPVYVEISQFERTNLRNPCFLASHHYTALWGFWKMNISILASRTKFQQTKNDTKTLKRKILLQNLSNPKPYFTFISECTRQIKKPLFNYFI